MGNATHPTRTLLVSKKFPNHIVVARGSNGNIDPEAAEMETGSSQVRVFDLTRVPKDGHAWIDGRTLAWGTRNEVGLDEDQAGNVWGVENSADNVFRRGIDVHQTNPAEKVHSCKSEIRRCGFICADSATTRSRSCAWKTGHVLRIPILFQRLGSCSVPRGQLQARRLVCATAERHDQRRVLQRKCGQAHAVDPTSLCSARYDVWPRPRLKSLRCVAY